MKAINDHIGHFVQIAKSVLQSQKRIYKKPKTFESRGGGECKKQT